VFRSRASTDYGFENELAKCELFQLDSQNTCSAVFTETRAGTEPEASSCEIRGMGGYGIPPNAPESDCSGSFAFVRRVGGFIAKLYHSEAEVGLPEASSSKVTAVAAFADNRTVSPSVSATKLKSM
jgi:hypothetical protein